MYYKKNSFNLSIFLILIILSCMVSCIPAKKINYLQEKSGRTGETIFSPELQQYKVQSGDNLYISFSSLDPETALILEPGKTNNVQNEGGRKYKDIYIVDSKGYVDIPQIGKVYINDLNLEEITDTIDYSISKYFKQINVQVRLADAYITIIGEVNRPGRYKIEFDDKITVFDLVGTAGDLTIHANRTEIKLVRRDGKNTKIHHINLTDKNILGKEHFYLMPNDIIYVEQLDAVFLDKKSFPFFSSLSVILSTTTSILVILTYLSR